jgi:Domain of unknown function (DUF4333)
MSSSYQDQPFSSHDPWHGQQPVPAPSQQPQQSPPTQPYGQPLAPKQKNGLAIAALLVAGFALLVAVGGFVSQIFMGMMFSGPTPFGADMQGTAPQVVTGQTYSGTLLQGEVSRVIRGDGGQVLSISCPATRAVEAGAVAVCHAVIDGSDSSVSVTFDDGLGHFTLVES